MEGLVFLSKRMFTKHGALHNYGIRERFDIRWQAGRILWETTEEIDLQSYC